MSDLLDKYFESKFSGGQDRDDAIGDDAAVKIMEDGRVYDLGAIFATYHAQTDTFRSGNFSVPRPDTLFAGWAAAGQGESEAVKRAQDRLAKMKALAEAEPCGWCGGNDWAIYEARALAVCRECDCTKPVIIRE